MSTTAEIKQSCDLCGAHAKILHIIRAFTKWEDGLTVCEKCLTKLRNYLEATK